MDWIYPVCVLVIIQLSQFSSSAQTVSILLVTINSWRAFDIHQRALLPSQLPSQHGLHIICLDCLSVF